MDPSDVTVGIAFLAGLASFLSPCVLALVPAYVSYLGGWSVSSSDEVTDHPWQIFFHGLAFIIGFSLIFITFGMAVSALGALKHDISNWFSKISGVLVIVFGLHTMGVINIPFLNVDTRRQFKPNPNLGYLSSFLMGIFFSAGWSPCIGPVLGSILTLAINFANIKSGIILLSAYSSGLAIPFLLAALGIGGITDLLRKFSKVIRGIAFVTGAVLIILGVMLFSGTL